MSLLSLGRLTVFSYFMSIYVAFILLLAGVGAVHYHANYQTQRTSHLSKETLNVGLARRMLVSDIAAVTTDLKFLSQHISTLDISARPGEAQNDYVMRIFESFSGEKGLYDQIRLIGTDGREVVRVNLVDDHPVVVPADQLQNKSSRYYFSEGMRLAPGEIYLSPLDLNVEDGVIEQPIKPVLRFVTGVFDSDGRHKGMVVLNYRGSRMLDRFREVAANISDHIQLVNSDGYWLSSPDKNQEWGFMLNRRDMTFGNRFAVAWQQISNGTSGQIERDEGLFTFATVLPRLEAHRAAHSDSTASDGNPWKVIAFLPHSSFVVTPGSFIASNSGLYLGLLALMGLVSALLAEAHERRRIAEERHEYEERFRRILEEIPLAAVMVDPAGRVTFCNHFLLDVSGWSSEEVVGSDWVERFVPADQRSEMHKLINTMQGPDTLPELFEGELETRSGDRRLMEWHNTLVRDTEGQILGVTALGEDVTEKRILEDEARKLLRAVEQSPSIVTITGRDGRIEYVNPKFCEVTRYRCEEVVGQNPSILKSGESPKELYADLWSSIRNGEEWRGEFHNRRKDGELYWASACISAVRDGDGEISHYLSVQEDITERKRLEEEVSKRNRELARSHTLAQMGRMASMIAHDLRNPLSSVKMAMHILTKQATDEEEELGQIGLEQIRYMENIIADMLTYSRPEAVNTEWLNMDRLMPSIVTSLQRRLDEAGTEVRLGIQPGLPAFPGDTNKLRQVFSNLLINATQATECRAEGERLIFIGVGLELNEAGTQLRVEVCDNGEGIDEDSCDKLFEPFWTTRAKGTGLGLAIVRQIVQQHGGEVTLEANQPQGTCAVVVLPTVPAEHQKMTPQAADAVSIGEET